MLERLTILFAAMMLLGPAAAHAQLTPVTGDRVRITQIDGSVHTGEVRTLSSSDMQILDDESGRTLIIPSAEVAGLERSLGKHGSFSKTFFTTVGVGLGVGLLVVGPFIPVCESYGPCSPGSRGAAMVQGMALGGLIAIPLGAILGASRKTERWAPADLPATDLGLSVTVGRSGSLGVRLDWRVGGGS